MSTFPEVIDEIIDGSTIDKFAGLVSDHYPVVIDIEFVKED